MRITMSGFGSVILAGMLLVGCQPKESAPAQARQLTQEETDKLFEAATNVEAVGEPMVRSTVVGDMTVTTTTQMMMVSRPGGGREPILGFCGGQCKVTVEGGTLGQCKTSGCAPQKNGSCTPLVCSGSCTLDRACKREPAISFTAAIQ
ncbi:MAG TPA: hypothetical protein VFP37_02070 [Steroidobacteraceae bacterium]|nr:hypothetical protein [Steroidobacteraceae bacterium]